MSDKTTILLSHGNFPPPFCLCTGTWHNPVFYEKFLSAGDLPAGLRHAVSLLHCVTAKPTPGRWYWQAQSLWTRTSGSILKKQERHRL